MLRLPLILSLSLAILAGCSSLPEVAAHETALSRNSTTPELLPTAEFKAAAGKRRPTGNANNLASLESEMQARGSQLENRAAKLRANVPVAAAESGDDAVMSRAEALKARAEALRQAGQAAE